MKLYRKSKRKYTDIYLGNCLDKLKQMEDNSVDAVITDPPYGYQGHNWDKSLPDKEVFKECFRVLKPGAFMCTMSAPRTDVYWRMCQRIEEAGFKVDFTPIVWSFATGFPKATNIGKMIDKRRRVERQVIGRNPNSIENCDKSNTIYESGTVGKTDFITKGNSEFGGAYGGFQPKPAVEMIIVAMKPLEEKTYIDQALKNGKGISWIDNCRIPFQSEKGKCKEGDNFATIEDNKSVESNPQGRFPANLLVSDDSLNDGKVYKRQQGATKGNEPRGDEGSYSRYFDLDRWYETQFAIFPKASKSEKNKGCEALNNRQVCRTNNAGEFKNIDRPVGNNHPTVKPIKLMAYLITMFSRKGDIILDPFMGSGTTGVASVLLERKFIGCEMNKGYVEIAKARLLSV